MADGLTVEERLDRVEAEQVVIREEMRAGFARLEARLADVPTRADVDDLRASVEDLRAGQTDLRAGQTDLRAGQTDLRAGQTDLRASVDDLRAGQEELRQAVRTLHDESAAANVELREYIDFAVERQGREARGYFDIVAEGLRDDVRKIAEAQVATTGKVDRLAQGQVATNERIDRLEQKMDRGFADVRGDIAALVQTLRKRGRQH